MDDRSMRRTCYLAQRLPAGSEGCSPPARSGAGVSHEERTFPACEAEPAPFFNVSRSEQDLRLGGLLCEGGDVSPSKDEPAGYKALASGSEERSSAHHGDTRIASRKSGLCDEL